jgi:hypothetical protein
MNGKQKEVVYKPLGYLHQALFFVLYTEGVGQAIYGMLGMVSAATPAGRQLWKMRIEAHAAEQRRRQDNN